MTDTLLEDTLLDELRFARDVYQLGQYTPVSMRDQIVRASYLVDRLWRRGSLSPASTLVVVGGGVAGITTTLRALGYGVAQVEMVDQARGFMSLQATNTSRMVDPVQYDWPATHWTQGKWPLPESANPRKYTAVTSMPPTNLATQTAAQWAVKFCNLMNGVMSRTNFTFHPNTVAKSWSRLDEADRCLLLSTDSTTNGASASIRADLIIFAGGFGGEKTTLQFQPSKVAHFQSIPFWTTDDFQKHDFGIKDLEQGVLVSGSGDGALQDYVRLVTGLNTCAEVMNIVLDSLASISWRSQAEGLWHWEDHAQRVRRIARPDELHFIQERLHARYEELVGNLVNSPDWDGVVSALDRKVGARPINKVYLAYKCNHFTWCYGLNHLVAMIVIAYARWRSREQQFEPTLPYHAAIATKDPGHGCHGICWGNSHPVVLGKDVQCKHDDEALSHWPEENREILTYDGLVIRHGIDPTSMFGKKVKLRPQQIPFHLP
jgi:hypothetical protein